LSTVYFSLLPTPKAAEKLIGVLLNRGAHSTLNRHLVNRFFEESLKRFLQIFQAVIAQVPSRFSGLPLKRDAHSTDLSRGVNGSL